MSEENVEIVRRAVEIVNARQVPEDLIAPDIRIQNVRTAVTDNLYVGAEGIRQWLRDFFGVVDHAQYQVDEIVSAGGELVVCKVSLVGRGLASGAPFEMRWFLVCRLSNGRITDIESYAGRRVALEAAGLSE